ncbi:MAG: zinc ribbon domain-containing protein [Gemmatimonadetes bacterium]|nr:zinc ribbon domain-containing protein [Gemmatimonadota bacterium]
MPVYEFICKDCQKTFEILRPISEAPHGAAPCPSCGSQKTERIWSSVFAITAKKS